jgi:hypothetical protein
VSQQCEKLAEFAANAEHKCAIGYQLELGSASERGNYGQILKMAGPNNPAKYNRYVITDPPVFKTTAIDHSAIPPHRNVA